MTKRLICMVAAMGALLFCAIHSADAAKLPRYGAFVYSSVCWERESGDAAGNRLMLIRDGDGNMLSWEWSEGAMMGPTSAYDISINDQTGAIRFSVDIGSEGVQDSDGHQSIAPPDVQKFSGTIADDAVTLSPDGHSDMKFAIPRVRDFSAKTTECKYR